MSAINIRGSVDIYIEHFQKAERALEANQFEKAMAHAAIAQAVSTCRIADKLTDIEHQIEQLA